MIAWLPWAGLLLSTQYAGIRGEKALTVLVARSHWETEVNIRQPSLVSVDHLQSFACGGTDVERLRLVFRHPEQNRYRFIRCLADAAQCDGCLSANQVARTLAIEQDALQ